MPTSESVEHDVLSTELKEALRTLLSRESEPYLDIPGTSDSPGICISTSLAAFRRYIETKHQEKLDSQPKVPANYVLGGGRRKLPEGRRVYCEAGTQTDPTPEALVYIATQSRSNTRPGTPNQTESAPEASIRKRKVLRRAPLSRAICSSSSDTSPGARASTSRSPQRQGLCPLANVVAILRLVRICSSVTGGIQPVCMGEGDQQAN